ncbi:hypothetical protein DUNSADRAFT_14219 [Dunaliella salina]|uniref:EF-hand domain-containing protein n=1 Tax=Dunaliella salina TaxID=3046 RepID=A0ABQ7G7R7_DUNSA|nr:hypothetical protein DUNSADRAFT_14219 [Dunaliella salina]|eukprot:KAF5830653.1 hypothetical protein DUNSADRAFT_14219 [Dunaliella salina]
MTSYDQVMSDVSELSSELLFNLGKRTPQLVKRRAPQPLPFSCISLRLKGDGASTPHVHSSPLKKGAFTVGKQQRQAGHKDASIRGDASMQMGSPFCSITTSNTPDKWSGSELLQSILLRLLPGLKHELDYLAWEELQVGQQLPPGTAAEENEAKTRRRDKKKKAGEMGSKQFRVATGEEQLWEVFSEFCGRDGYISSSELRAALLKLGLPCTPEYLRLLMNELDVDHDSKVDWPDNRAFSTAYSRRGFTLVRVRLIGPTLGHSLACEAGASKRHSRPLTKMVMGSSQWMSWNRPSPRQASQRMMRRFAG